MSGAPISTVVMAGAPARDAILASLSQRIQKAGSPHIALATVLVGDDAPSRKYVASKHATAQSIGIESVQVELSLPSRIFSSSRNLEFIYRL